MDNVVFIVEGHCEYDTFLTFISKILGHVYIPISNAKGIGNIIQNTGNELLYVIKLHKPDKIIITLDYREALREKIVNNCIELKEKIYANCEEFIISQKNGSLKMPSEIIVIIADKTYESWLCADYEGLKTNTLIKAESITETYQNVDTEIQCPSSWLIRKLKTGVDLKKKANRKQIASTMRPEIACQNSRSFRKFYTEVLKIKVP